MSQKTVKDEDIEEATNTMSNILEVVRDRISDLRRIWESRSGLTKPIFNYGGSKPTSSALTTMSSTSPPEQRSNDTVGTLKHTLDSTQKSITKINGE